MLTCTELTAIDTSQFLKQPYNATLQPYNKTSENTNFNVQESEFLFFLNSVSDYVNTCSRNVYRVIFSHRNCFLKLSASFFISFIFQRRLSAQEFLFLRLLLLRRLLLPLEQMNAHWTTEELDATNKHINKTRKHSSIAGFFK